MNPEISKGETVIVWFPDSECLSEENTSLLRRLREAGFRVFVASFPDLTTPCLFIRDSMYSGEKAKRCITGLTEKVI